MSNKKFVDLENLSRFWGDSDSGLKKYIDDRDAAVLTIASTAISSHASKATSKTESGHVKIGDNISVSTSGVISLTQENVIDALGYTPPTTNTTYNVATSSVDGLVPAIGTAAASTIGSQSTEWVLASTNGNTPTWRKLPSNAFSNTTYSAGSGLTTSGTTFSLKTGYTNNGKNYKVQLDSSGNPYVNVPWTDTDTNTTYSAGSGLTSSGTTFSLKTGYTDNGKNYKVQLDSSGNPFVNVPWTDTNTTYSFSNKAATLSWGTTTTIATVGGTNITITMPANPNTDTNTTYSAGSGLSLTGTTFSLKTGYTNNGKNYKVQLDSDGNPYVNVPWTNTTYSLATTSVNGLMSSSQVSKLDGIATGANKVTATSQLTNDSGFITGITKSMVTTALGYTPPTTNTTYSTVTSSVAGLAPKIGTVAASTIGTQSTEWVLASTNGGTPSWRKLPANAFNNTTYSFNNSAATLSWGTTTTIATVGGTNITVKMPANPNTNTTYSAGSGLSLSGTTFSLKTGYTDNGKNYKVQLDSNGNPYVNVPWTDTNTTYSLATTGANGLMSSAQVSKLNGIADGANKVTATSQLTNDSGFITGITKSMVTTALGYTPPTANTTYSVATTSTNGLMSSAHVSKLNTINTTSYYGIGDSSLIFRVYGSSLYHFKDGSTYYPIITSENIGSYAITSLTKTMVTNALGYTPPTTNTTYSLATTTSNGLMSSAQVSKLNSLSTAVATSTSNGLMSATQCSMVIPNARSGADIIGRTANTLYLNTKSSLLVTTASNTYYVLHSGNYNQYIDQVLDSQKWNGYTISVSSSIPTNASSTQITFVI